MRIFFSPKFKRAYKKLPKEIQTKAKERIGIFQKNPFDSRLKTHKLHGAFSEFWSFTITHAYRVVFEFADTDTIHFHLIGDHAVYE